MLRNTGFLSFPTSSLGIHIYTLPRRSVGARLNIRNCGHTHFVIADLIRNLAQGDERLATAPKSPF